MPAARPDVICAGNADRLTAQLVLQGANVPFTGEAERMLHNRGVSVAPDFVANAGGVICAAMEYQGATQAAAFAAIAEKVGANCAEILQAAHERKVLPSAPATTPAMVRVTEATRCQRFGVF
jgi:glutamate dehydrogenase (NAD(P)+)